MEMIVDGVSVTVSGFNDMSESEIREYIKIIKDDTNRNLISLAITSEPNGEVGLDYVLSAKKFERVRRITGYLVGTMDRWNVAKRAEEKDRVKHSL